MIAIGKPLDDFTLPASGGQDFHLAAARGKSLVLYFYPKDSTPGCTVEAGQFRDLHPQFAKLGCGVYGISRDSIKSHENFKDKLALPFDLISDAEEKLCQMFGVIKMKKMYGKEVRGIERSTFLVDSAGILRREWRGVKTDGHAAEVLAALQSL